MNLDVIRKIGGPRTQRAILVGKKYSPEILTGVGIVSGVASTILAARATLRLEPVIRQLEDRIALAHLRRGEGIGDYNKEMSAAYLWATLQLSKLYGPAALLGVASITSILSAHGIMRKRQVALVAAYNSVAMAFEAYRKRVIEEFGEDKDRDFNFGIYEEVTTDKATGKKTKAARLDPNHPSQHAQFFDDKNVNWDRTPEYSLIFLRAQERYANDLLVSRGHVMLNDVYDAIGLERTDAGAIIGWLYNYDLPPEENHIDFGIYDPDSERGRRFVNGDEENILLDFNVDGIIWDKISSNKKEWTGRTR